ncbi:MAG: hypothetical protein ACK5U8_12100 [Deltaproteobacteria bacterium]|jgi:hypothetical protein
MRTKNLVPGLLLSAFALFGCSAEGRPIAGGDAGPCRPRSCLASGAECGVLSDGCGGTLDCGGCGNAERCGTGSDANRCVALCTPRTCAELGATCGPQGDGCGGSLDCGRCTVAGETCGGGGTPNRCGVGMCAPATCAARSLECGSVGDGCGALLDCGTCAAGEACGVVAPNRCDPVCTPTTCAALGAECGSAPDGCGGTLTCPACPAGQTCGVGGANSCGVAPPDAGLIDAGGSDAYVPGDGCPGGSHRVGSECVVNGGVRPIAPLSLGDTSLQRPTLRFELPRGADGAVIELCSDRACTTVIETLRVSGASARPSAALPASSVVFWRGRARVGASEDSIANHGPTWLFHTPARDNSGGVDTSTHPHLDVNGDGFDDVAVGALRASPGGRSLAGTVAVYLGSVAGLAPSPSVTLEGEMTGELSGISVAGAGDLDGDGYGELAVGASNTFPAGRVRVYHGSMVGLAAAPRTILRGDSLLGPSREEPAFGESVAGAGDLNGDGYADLVVGAYETTPVGLGESGAASVFHGSVTGLGATPTITLVGGVDEAFLGCSVASAGDVNGDGFSDLVIGASTSTVGGLRHAGIASVFHGSATGIARDASQRLVGSRANAWFGDNVAGAGDVNGDGYSDLIVTAASAVLPGEMAFGSVSVFHGSRAGTVATAATVLDETSRVEGWVPSSVSSAGDLDGDGFGDIAVGASGTSPGGRSAAGMVGVYRGGADGIAATAAQTLEGLVAGDWFGASVAGAGDVNGDGIPDLVVGAPFASPGGRRNAGAAFVHHGRAMRLAATATSTFEGSAPTDWFGRCVASLGGIRRLGVRGIAEPFIAGTTLPREGGLLPG